MICKELCSPPGESVNAAVYPARSANRTLQQLLMLHAAGFWTSPAHKQGLWMQFSQESVFQLWLLVSLALLPSFCLWQLVNDPVPKASSPQCWPCWAQLLTA